MNFLTKLFSPSVIQSSLPVTILGAIPDATNMASDLASLALNGQSSAGGVGYSTSAGASLTLTSLGNFEQVLSNGGAVTVTLDSAYNIGLSLPSPLTVGQKFTFAITALTTTTVATPTLSDTAVTLAGTTSVVATGRRLYQGVFTQVNSVTGSQFTAGTTFTSLTQVGSTNNYTVALGTNAITPTVGNLIFLNVTSGTLPSGWYPINKVTSATSFVIAAPTSSAAWTATVATVGTSTVAPATYSPLITITGLYAATAYVA